MVDAYARRLARLAEELEENGLPLDDAGPPRTVLLDEIDYALRPAVHERRVPSTGTILSPRASPTGWSAQTKLAVSRASMDGQPLMAARRYADGLSTWLLRWDDGSVDWLVFDRPAGSERDLVVLASKLEATVVQRHPGGLVRVVGTFGVLRWDGFRWHLEPPVEALVGPVLASGESGDRAVIAALLEFAVHDLGAWGVGSLLVYRPHADPGPLLDEHLPPPPELNILGPAHLAPLRHALAQIDGAAVFDGSGVLRRLGVRLVPSPRAEHDVEGLGGTRHTSGRRYSYDDPQAIVVAVSEDGPVSVLRNGRVVATSRG